MAVAQRSGRAKAYLRAVPLARWPVDEARPYQDQDGLIESNRVVAYTSRSLLKSVARSEGGTRAHQERNREIGVGARHQRSCRFPKRLSSAERGKE